MQRFEWRPSQPVPSLWAASLALSDPDQQPRQIGEMSVGGASYSSRSSGFPGLCRTCVAGSRTCGGPERSKPVSSFWRSEGGRSFTLGCRCPMGASSTATSSPAVSTGCAADEDASPACAHALAGPVARNRTASQLSHVRDLHNSRRRRPAPSHRHPTAETSPEPIARREARSSSWPRKSLRPSAEAC